MKEVKFVSSLVRLNIKKLDHSKMLDNFRRHLDKSKANIVYYLVKEVSPNELVHIHGIVIYETIEDKYKLEEYLDTHHSKMYIDKYKDLPSRDVSAFLKYIRKNINDNSEKYIDFVYKNSKDYVWEEKIISNPFIESGIVNLHTSAETEGSRNPEGESTILSQKYDIQNLIK